MKISYRILIINFAIVALILGSSAFAFYSIIYEVLTAQQSKYLLNSANNLAYRIRDVQQEWTSYIIYNKTMRGEFINPEYSNPQDPDFIFENTNNSLSVRSANKVLTNIPGTSFTLEEFLNENPFAICTSFKEPDGRHYYYGKIVTGEFLTYLSKSINAEIAVIDHDTPAEISNAGINQNHLQVLLDACINLKDKSSFQVYSGSGGSTDLIATVYRNVQSDIPGSEMRFLVFNPLTEASVLRENVQTILIVIGSAGVILSIILTLLFTGKIRKQIAVLIKATEISSEGKFLNKINIKSKDEVGQLAKSFNGMMDELEKHQRSLNEYSEFITLLNQNPSLSEVSDAALKKIIKSCGFTAGALYSVYNEEISLTSSFGTKSGITSREDNDLFYTVIKNKEIFELIFDDQKPFISSGLYEISIKYLLIQPVLYNNKVIAILELGGIEKPGEEVRNYLDRIQEQLAIGLTNAGAFVQLENIVSELKNLNEEYQKQNIRISKQNQTLTELHKKLEEKAAELSDQKERAEESTKLKSQFLANVSHELRTPMNSVLGLTELILKENTLEKKTKERLEVVLKNGRRLMTLINEVLDLSKIEAGKLEVNREDVVLLEIISDVESAIHHIAEKKNISYSIHTTIDTKVVINTDKGKVTQVLINLLDNGIKFTEKGFVRLNISTESNYLKFKVSDSGIGIAAKDLEYIFNEFRQVDGTTARKYSGTGLGLAICKKIAEMLDGYISVESEPGKGSVFTFAVPLHSASEIKDIAGETYSQVETIKANKKKILVVDNNPDIRYTIGQYLVSRNYEAVFAVNKEEALSSAVKHLPAAVIIDSRLPKGESWDLLINLKSEEQFRDTAVIFQSTSEDGNFGYALAPRDYITKPVTGDKLKPVLESLRKAAGENPGRTIILNENKTEAEDLQNILSDSGISAEVIHNGEEVLNIVTQDETDLIIIDLMFRRTEAIQIISSLKSRRDTRHIPLIITVPERLTQSEKEELDNSLMQAVFKFKGHPLDMLKVIRDRLELQNISFNREGAVSDKHHTSSDRHVMIEEVEYLGEVLIVDDDADTLFTLNEIVKACNCKTIIAKSGAECLSILQQKTPDLILLDIMMPGMDGFQTLTKIKKHKKTAATPVFAVTAKAMAEDKQIILRHGFDDYISKPVNSGVIAFKIEKLLSKLKTV